MTHVGSEDPDPLGDEVKRFEDIEAGRKMMPGLPVCARLDGRAFHTFTRGCLRPSDPGMAGAMIETARALVDEFHASVGYSQSDEITLLWRAPEHFDGRFQKLSSVLAGYASSVFVQEVIRRLPGRERMNPCFDCRVWQVPTREDAINVLYWREADAVKNSVQMAARSVYSHKELHGKGRRELMDLLMAKGINWNDYLPHFKRGVYLQRVVFERSLTEEERSRIPETHRPPVDQKFKRSRVEILDLPPLRQMSNAVDRLLPVPVEAPPQ